MSSNRLMALDGLRGIAAIAVVLFHLSQSTYRNFPFGMGYLAVDFFFLLSGFVLGQAYEHKLQTGEVSLLRYGRARAARLLPMILLGTVLGAIFFKSEFVSLKVPLVVALAMQAVCIPTLAFGTHLFPLNAVQWSLLFEILANAFHAIFVRRLSPRLLAMIMVLSFAALCIAAYFRTNALNGGFYLENIPVGLARVGFAFFAGIAMAHLHRAGGLRVPGLPFSVLGAALAGLLFLPDLDGPLWSTLELAMVGLAFPLIVASGANSEVRGIESIVAHFLGSISYPLYLMHSALMAAASPLIKPLPATLKLPAWFAVICGIICLAWVADKLIDQPAQRLLRGRGQPKSLGPLKAAEAQPVTDRSR